MMTIFFCYLLSLMFNLLLMLCFENWLENIFKKEDSLHLIAFTSGPFMILVYIYAFIKKIQKQKKEKFIDKIKFPLFIRYVKRCNLHYRLIKYKEIEFNDEFILFESGLNGYQIDNFYCIIRRLIDTDK